MSTTTTRYSLKLTPPILRFGGHNTHVSIRKYIGLICLFLFIAITYLQSVDRNQQIIYWISYSYNAITHSTSYSYNEFGYRYYYDDKYKHNREQDLYNKGSGRYKVTPPCNGTNNHSSCHESVVQLHKGDFNTNGLKFTYPEQVKHCTIVNNGHTVQVNIPSSAKCKLSIYDKEFELK
eukprot:538697_1